MGNAYDRDRGDSRGNQGRGASFNQQGQQVNGPQYNADQINIGESISPDDIAEGLRRDRERTLRERESAAQIQRERAAQFQREQARRRQEERDLATYGYRHYTRDRNRWLQSLPPQERWNEERRRKARSKNGTTPWRHHQRILRAGNLPPETSPADPRYVQAKREVERKGDKRELNYTIASLVVALALILIAVLDNALWLAVILGSLVIIGLVSGYRKGRASP
ncbi:hypothetical protein [Streptomyces sp. NPDC059649]|uniref:hypothetical protein n=1 Tax=Streptomyces sp. NPDC059649 TaxID=3346895 RepID=UPI0036B8342A